MKESVRRVRRHQHGCRPCQLWHANPSVPKMADLMPTRLRIYKLSFRLARVDCFGKFSVTFGRRTEKCCRTLMPDPVHLTWPVLFGGHPRAQTPQPTRSPEQSKCNFPLVTCGIRLLLYTDLPPSCGLLLIWHGVGDNWERERERGTERGRER